MAVWLQRFFLILLSCVCENAQADSISIYLNDNVMKCFTLVFEEDVENETEHPYTELGNLSFNLVFTRDSELFEQRPYKDVCDLYDEISTRKIKKLEKLIKEREVTGEEELGLDPRENGKLNLEQALIKFEIGSRINLALADEAVRLGEYNVASAGYLSVVDSFMDYRKFKNETPEVPRIYPDAYLLGMAIKGFEITRPFVLKKRNETNDGMTEHFIELKKEVEEFIQVEAD
jgi:hypothetical protein